MGLSESDLRTFGDGRLGGPFRWVPADVWSRALTLALPETGPKKIVSGGRTRTAWNGDFTEGVDRCLTG
jgi:hypothetical protein